MVSIECIPCASLYVASSWYNEEIRSICSLWRFWSRANITFGNTELASHYYVITINIIILISQVTNRHNPMDDGGGQVMDNKNNNLDHIHCRVLPQLCLSVSCPFGGYGLINYYSKSDILIPSTTCVPDGSMYLWTIGSEWMARN